MSSTWLTYFSTFLCPVRADDNHNRFGSLAAVTGRWAGSDSFLLDWLEEGTESSLRDTEADVSQPPVLAAHSSAARSISSTSARPSPVVLTPVGGVSPAGSFTKQQEGTKAAYMDLDKFYEDTEDAEETDESGSESDEEEEEDGEGGGEEAESSEQDSDKETQSEEEHVQGTTT